MARENDVTPPTGIVPEEPAELSLAEISRASAVPAEFIVELVEEGVLAPAEHEPEHWRFTYAHIRRVRVASHLRRDLGVNLAGAALALDLLDQIEALRARLQALGGD